MQISQELLKQQRVGGIRATMLEYRGRRHQSNQIQLWLCHPELRAIMETWLALVTVPLQLTLSDSGR